MFKVLAERFIDHTNVIVGSGEGLREGPGSESR
jgi:hypothetical protein